MTVEPVPYSTLPFATAGRKPSEDFDLVGDTQLCLLNACVEFPTALFCPHLPRTVVELLHKLIDTTRVKLFTMHS